MLPKESFVLLSYINLKLRDFYPNLDDLCSDLNESKDEIISRLNEIGFKYDSKLNQFR